MCEKLAKELLVGKVATFLATCSTQKTRVTYVMHVNGVTYVTLP